MKKNEKSWNVTYQNPNRLQVLSNPLEFQKAPFTSGYLIIEQSKRKPNEKVYTNASVFI